MNILIESYYDCFVVVVNGNRFHVSDCTLDEDGQTNLLEAFKCACPDATVEVEEVY